MIYPYYRKQADDFLRSVYTSGAPEDADDNLYFVARGGAATFTDVEAHAMDTIWLRTGDVPKPAVVLPN